MNSRIWLLVFVSCVSNWSACYAQDFAAQSALANVSLNNFSWTSFDVLIEEQSFVDKEDLGVVGAKIYHRIVFDSELERGAYFKLGEATSIVPGNQFDKARKREQQSAFGGISDGKVTVYRKFPGPPSKFIETDFKTMYSKMQCPNPRLFGQTLISESQIWDERATDSVAHHRAIANAYKVSSESITVEVPLQGPSDNRAIVILWTFSKDTGFPSQARLATRHLDKKVDYPTRNEFYKWGEINGLAVPTEVYVEKGQVAFDGDGKEVLNIQTVEYKINWISLNNKSRLMLPTIETLDDIQKFREATSPETLKSRFIAVKEL